MLIIEFCMALPKFLDKYPNQTVDDPHLHIWNLVVIVTATLRFIFTPKNDVELKSHVNENVHTQTNRLFF